LTLAVVVSVQWGIDAVAASVTLVAVTLFLPQAVFVSRTVGFSLPAYGAAQVPAAVAGGVMALAWFGVTAVLESAGAGPLVVLLAATPASLIAYVATARLVRPTVFSEMAEMFTLARRNRRRGAVPTDGSDETADPEPTADPSAATSAEPDDADRGDRRPGDQQPDDHDTGDQHTSARHSDVEHSEAQHRKDER
jgi:hypothetical protein